MKIMGCWLLIPLPLAVLFILVEGLPAPQISQHGQPQAGSVSTPIPGNILFPVGGGGVGGIRRTLSGWREWRRADPTLIHSLWRSKMGNGIRKQLGKAEVYIMLALFIGLVTVVIGCWLSDNCWSPDPDNYVVTVAWPTPKPPNMNSVHTTLEVENESSNTSSRESTTDSDWPLEGSTNGDSINLWHQILPDEAFFEAEEDEELEEEEEEEANADQIIDHTNFCQLHKQDSLMDDKDVYRECRLDIDECLWLWTFLWRSS